MSVPPARHHHLARVQYGHPSPGPCRSAAAWTGVPTVAAPSSRRRTRCPCWDRTVPRFRSTPTPTCARPPWRSRSPAAWAHWSSSGELMTRASERVATCSWEAASIGCSAPGQPVAVPTPQSNKDKPITLFIWNSHARATLSASYTRRRARTDMRGFTVFVYANEWSHPFNAPPPARWRGARPHHSAVPVDDPPGGRAPPRGSAASSAVMDSRAA